MVDYPHSKSACTLILLANRSMMVSESRIVNEQLELVYYLQFIGRWLHERIVHFADYG
jgi:hypothetical protein